MAGAELEGDGEDAVADWEEPVGAVDGPRE